GYIDPEDVDPAGGALREFREETGYDVRWYAAAGSHVRHPTRNTNRGHLVVATGAHKTDVQHLDAAEDIEVVLMSIDATLDAVRDGRITAVGTVASIFLGYDTLQRLGRA
ncbi:MAG: NUDIX hydrolase, partial [Chloroflexota bacterium]